jgi:hypothetical protein
VTTTLFLGQHIHLTLELGVRRDTARLAQHLTTLDLFLGATQQRTDVVTRPTLIEQLAEHLHTRTRRLLRRRIPTISISSPVFTTPAPPTRHHRATTRDREHILDRHQERLVGITHRLRDERIGTASINSMT